MRNQLDLADDFGDEGFGPGTDLVFSILAILIVIVVAQQIAAIQYSAELAALRKPTDTDLSYVRKAKTSFLDQMSFNCEVNPISFIPNQQIEIRSPYCDMVIKDEPQFQTIIFNESVLFDVREFDLKPGGAEVLRLVRSVMNQRQSDIVEVQILGHTDNIGGEEFNLELGYKRAREVFGLLTDQASPESLDPLETLISVTTYSFYRPVARRDADFSQEQLELSNGDDFQRAGNRRIELNIFYRKGPSSIR